MSSSLRCEVCEKSFGLTTSKVICGKCLKAYCGGCIGHPSLEVRLRGDGVYDPTGEWSRVCTSCFVQRPTNDFKGLTRDLTPILNERREHYGQERELEVYRLEQRLERLMNWNAVTPLKEYEQSVVPWQRDVEVRECKCGRSFERTLLERKHHCRLCGRIMCSACSLYLPIRVSREIVNNTRICATCDSLVMHRNDGNQLKKGPLDEVFGKMMYLKEQVLALMPRYEELLGECRERKVSEDALRILYMETSAARDTLMLQFLHLESATKTLKPTEQSSKGYEGLLRENMYKAMQLFLQRNLLKLQLLPSFEELKKQRKELHEQSERIQTSQSEDSAGGKRAFIKQIYEYMTTTTSNEIQTAEGEGVLLANLQTLVNKAKVLREQEEQLQAMISSCESADDKVFMREALIECQQELTIVSDLLKQI